MKHLGHAWMVLQMRLLHEDQSRIAYCCAAGGFVNCIVKAVMAACMRIKGRRG
jgi:hypothetical protein